MATADSPFVVRILPSSGLEGAFRVHLSPESLEKLDLKVSDICQITGEDGNIGYGIAWRATDKMGNSPKLRPAKMTDPFRAAWSFKEGSHVTITKTTATILRADKVTFSDVTPSDYAASNDPSNDRWKLWMSGLLADCEAIAVGTTFDVTTKKKLKKRFYVDHIASAAVNNNSPALFYCHSETEFVFADASTHVDNAGLPNGDTFPVLDTTKIGGLVEQVKVLNARLDYVLNMPHNNRARYPHLERHTILHGYEGTGKSLLLRCIKEANASRTFTIRKDATSTKTHAHIQSVFKEALASQPSVVVIDALDTLASKDNDPTASTLADEVDRLRGSSVYVVAAARSLMDVNNVLRYPGRLSNEIELPIPDLNSRKEILNVLLRQTVVEDTLAAAVSSRTHGFTGRDLARLCEEVRERVILRNSTQEARDGWVDVHTRLSMLANTPISTQVDGSVASQATTEVGNGGGVPDDELVVLTLGDFNEVLDAEIVKPTALREVFLEKPKVRWSDIGGSEALQKRFDEIIGWPLHRPDLVAENDLKPIKGVLLYGPPGCSKTMTAQAVATMYDLNFMAVKGAELISMYVGESEKAVRELFRKARQAAPCVIFFDEIDSIGSQREDGGSGSKGLNVLTTLLNEMDGFEAMKNVLVLAATNRPEVLDPALLRSGRFNKHIYVGLPSADARRQILEISLRKSKVLMQHLTNVEQAVSSTEGYSGAEIVEICEVVKYAMTRKQMVDTGSTPSDADVASAFEEAFRQVRKGITAEMLAGYEAFANR